MIRITPVILCGGSGTRLWPLSRKNNPKPFHALTSERTMLAETLARCAGDPVFTPPIVIGAAAHEALIAREISDDATLIIEPVAKNTAPAIGLAAATLPADTVMLVCPSDHHIADPNAFQAAAKRASELAGQGWLVSFGITPTAPETGYGYLKHGADLGGGAAEIDRFIEKPALEHATAFLAEGNCSWNGGIFAFTAGRYLQELQRLRPDMSAAVIEAADHSEHRGNRIYPARAPLEGLEAISIDYAVMEHTDRAAMVKVDMGWSDIGNWEALRAILAHDDSGNAASEPHRLMRCKDTLIFSDGPRVSALGLDGISIIVDGNDVLVIGASEAQHVGKLSD